MLQRLLTSLICPELLFMAGLMVTQLVLVNFYSLLVKFIVQKIIIVLILFCHYCFIYAFKCFLVHKETETALFLCSSGCRPVNKMVNKDETVFFLVLSVMQEVTCPCLVWFNALMCLR